MEDNLEAQNKNSIESKQYTNSLPLTAGLLKLSLNKLFLLYPLLVITQLFIYFVEFETTFEIIFVSLVQRAFELTFFILFLKYLDSSTKFKLNLKNNEINFFIFGFVTWAVLNIPYVLLLTQNTNPIFIILFWPAFYLYLKLFFFFKPILQTESKNLSLNEYAKSVFNESSISIITPLKIIFVAYVILFFIQSFLGLFDPLQTSSLSEVIKALLSGIPFVFSTVLAISYILLNYTNTDKDVIKYITKNSSAFIVKNLTIKRIIKILIISLLVTLGNQVRVLTTKPNFKININKVDVEDNKVTLILNINSKNKSLKNIQPLIFRLADKNNKALAELPEIEILKDNKKSESLKLVFKTKNKRKKEHIITLKDIYIWYAYTKMTKVEFN